MSRQAKKRTKAYRPKYIARNVLSTMFGGMAGEHAEHLQTVNLQNHVALSNLARGVGDKNDWDRAVGMVNMAIVLCEQGFGPDFHAALVAGREALLSCGMRAVKNNHRFLFTGDELKAINAASERHDAQLEGIRAIDVERAYVEVERRLRHRINSTSVMAEIRKEQAEAEA